MQRRAYEQAGDGASCWCCATDAQVFIALWSSLMLALVIGTATAVQAGSPSIVSSRQYTFDIDAQPLGDALVAYSGVTGIETLYDSAVARGHGSAPVKGAFNAVDALRAMLVGTGLSARPIAQDAVTIELQPTPVRAAASPEHDNNDRRGYYGVIQASIARAFCSSDLVQPGAYRAIVKFSVTAMGQIRQPSLIGTTGRDDRDRMILRTLDGMSMAVPPPADLQQPIMMVILPRSSGAALNCGAVH